MTPDQKTLARKLWQEDLKVAEIAYQVGVGVGAIMHLAIRNRDDFPARPAPQGLTKDQIMDASKLWKLGHTSAQIAAKIGVQKMRLDNSIRANREHFPRRNDTRRARLETIVRSYERCERSGIRPDTMIFTTSTGYQCLMPRVSILERAI